MALRAQLIHDRALDRRLGVNACTLTVDSRHRDRLDRAHAEIDDIDDGLKNGADDHAPPWSPADEARPAILQHHGLHPAGGQGLPGSPRIHASGNGTEELT